MITVTLTPDEVFIAAAHGIQRRIRKIEGKRGDREQKERSIWDNEIEGSCAELAWAKKRGKYWAGVSYLRSIDALDAEIRWTRHDDGGLIIYANDSDTSSYVLAKGFAPTFNFVGWIYGHQARKIGKKTDFGILVPESSLIKFERVAA